MKGKKIYYSERELSWIKSHCTDVRKGMHSAYCARFERNVSLVNLNSLCKRNGWLTGRTGRLERGSKPWNRGKKMPFNANSAKTQFKKGHAPQNTKYLGHERISKDGYVEISVAETNPHTGYERRYVHKHRHLWEQQRGLVPEGMVLKCLSGNKTDTHPDNWKLIPRAMLPRLNGRFGRDYDNAPEGVKPAIMVTAEIEHRARELRAAK